MTDLNDIEFSETEGIHTTEKEETLNNEPVLTFYKYDTDGFYRLTLSEKITVLFQSLMN